MDPALFPTAANVFGGNVNPVYEFLDGRDQPIRIRLAGDVVAEFIGVEIHPGDDDLGIAPGQTTAVDLRGRETLDGDGNLPEGQVGADIFKIYIAQASRGSYISIAEVPDFDATGHYARPDVFQLTVDTRAKRPVTEL
ncbi:MAG TPA: hypothetical protein PKC84_14745 [Paracoccaceae bacterium]|nr:hypothetical protein [Paracoccaceae bacterium]